MAAEAKLPRCLIRSGECKQVIYRRRKPWPTSATLATLYSWGHAKLESPEPDAKNWSGCGECFAKRWRPCQIVQWLCCLWLQDKRIPHFSPSFDWRYSDHRKVVMVLVWEEQDRMQLTFNKVFRCYRAGLMHLIGGMTACNICFCFLRHGWKAHGTYPWITKSGLPAFFSSLPR